MADPHRRRSQNAPGDVYVDETCIDCGTCMWMQPEVFAEAGGKSAVHTQPSSEAVFRSAQAAVACPTGSIGVPASALRAASSSFPHPLTDRVWHCGYHSRDSFGAASYLVRTEAGNVLVDSPRFAGPLVERLDALGGVDWMVLSHQDDVADHVRFAERFGCKRAIHAGDAGAVPEAEQVLQGDEGKIAGLQWMHVPGHTKGHVVYRFGDVLFAGDHLAWSRTRERLTAFRRANWYSWPEQIRSMERLSTWRFGHVLPGHGAPVRLPHSEMQVQMQALVDWMRTVS